MPGKSSSSSSPPSGGAGRSTRSGSSGTGRSMPLCEDLPGGLLRYRYLWSLWYRCQSTAPGCPAPRSRGAIASSGFPRLLGPAEEDLTFTDVRLSTPPDKILKMVLPFQAAFVEGCFLPMVDFHWSSFPKILAVLELVDRFTLGVEELIGDRTRSRKYVSCRSRL